MTTSKSATWPVREWPRELLLPEDCSFLPDIKDCATNVSRADAPTSAAEELARFRANQSLRKASLTVTEGEVQAKKPRHLPEMEKFLDDQIALLRSRGYVLI